MAEIYHPLTVHEVVPRFKSTIFDGHENARFAVGQVAEGDISLYPEENLAYHQLRANVYARQAGFIPLEDINERNGGEYDSDDSRSVHMIILENMGEDQRLIASMRLIKRTDNRPLPVEELFPDVFANNPAPKASCEVSRYITRHEDRKIQDMASWTLFQQGLTQAMIHRFSPAFAVVAPELSRIFRSRRLPIQELSEPFWIEKYGEKNVPIAIDIDALAERLESRTPGALSEMIANQGEFTYFRERQPEVNAVVRNIGRAAASMRSEKDI